MYSRVACGLLRPGDMVVIPSLKGTWICIPTKDDPRQPSTFAWVEKGLFNIRDFCVTHPDTPVALPALGCGLGGLDWYPVWVRMTELFRDVPQEVLGWPPQ